MEKEASGESSPSLYHIEKSPVREVKKAVALSISS